MNSYAVIPIDMKKMSISSLAANSNKNLQGIASAGFIIVKKQALEKIKTLRPRRKISRFIQESGTMNTSRVADGRDCAHFCCSRNMYSE